jgi:hypothetical protein
VTVDPNARFDSPQKAALGDFGEGYTGGVVASIVVGDFAALVVTTDTQGAYDDLSICHRDGRGWYEYSSTSGRQSWWSTNADGTRGLLCFWSRGEPGTGPFLVVDGDRKFTVTPEPSGYWVWAADDMPRSAMDTTEIRDL